MPSNKPGTAAIDAALAKLKHTNAKDALEPGLELAQTILDLFVGEPQPSVEDIVSDGLMQMPNAERQDAWFVNHPWMDGARSAFEIFDGIAKPVQAKFFWLKKKNAAQIAGAVHFTPNWEDFEYTRQGEAFKVGVDFFLSPDSKSFYVVLSNSGKLRVMELSERLNRTQVEILESWIELETFNTQAEIHTALWKSFQLQSVNAQFYAGVSDAFLELVDKLSADGREEEDSKLFASRLLGRLIFVWFLRKMGMVAGSIDYFSPEYFDSDSAYYKGALEPLFFKTLNEPHANRLTLNGLIDLETPYLNGGLFAPHGNDWVHDASLTFPTGYFERVFQHFQKFNFTVDESTPEFEQVAIDPEMLGRVFESLLATQVEETGEHARKAKGTFYTPREIVFSMCREAIRTYVMSERVSDDSFSKSIRHVLETSDQDWAKAGTNSLRDIPKDHREQILAKIGNLRSLDPACGSGAFPLGLLNVLTKVVMRLTPEANSHDVKARILQNSIFGVDIEPMAIEISKLRAWLSLIVEEAAKPKEVQPLPNLEFKFVCANSLIPLAGADEATLFDDGKIETELQEIRDKYFATKDPSKKAKLKDRFANAAVQGTVLFGEAKRSTQLRTFKPFEDNSVADFFDPGAMFGLENFDIVIGNPPYVRQEKIKYKDQLKNYQVFNTTSDLFTYFFERGFQLLAPRGVLSLITSSKFGRAVYGQKLRNYLTQNGTIDYIVDHQGNEQFTAAVNTWILQISNRLPVDGHLVSVILDESKKEIEIRQSDLGGQEWTFISEQERDSLSKLVSKWKPLSEFQAEIYYGIKTGCTEAFLLPDTVRDELLGASSKNSEIIFPVLRGRDIDRYAHKPASSSILVTKNGIDIVKDYPDVAKYLEQKNAELGGKIQARSDQGNHWMNLRDCKYYSSLESEKIVWSEMSANGRFCRASNSTYIIDTAYMLVTPHIEYLLAILNSSLVLAFISQSASKLGASGLRWKRHIIEQIPIPAIDQVPQESLAALRDLVIQRESKDCPNIAELEAQIDDLVFDVYQIRVEDRQAFKSMAN